MPNYAITRRRLLATGVSTTAALALGRFLVSTEALATELPDIKTFYDPRFAISRQLAGALPGASQLQAVRGDPSRLLAQFAPNSLRRRGMRLQGVTTESIPFCLEQLAQRHYDMCFESRRLERDLFAWSLALRVRPTVT
jgi:hypothetical protein